MFEGTFSLYTTRILKQELGSTIKPIQTSTDAKSVVDDCKSHTTKFAVLKIPKPYFVSGAGYQNLLYSLLKNGTYYVRGLAYPLSFLAYSFYS